MPSVVLSSFLLSVALTRLNVWIQCQCPQSCFLHFYVRIFAKKNFRLLVSMPSVVLSSFLRESDCLLWSEYDRCQCPQSCFLHFYKSCVGCWLVMSCVNALSRAFFISTNDENNNKRNYKRVNALSRAFFISTHSRRTQHYPQPQCQCPQSCFLHFYIYGVGIDFTYFFSCQCPQSCFLHFYKVETGVG